jgi:hypothetical protein
MTSVRRRVAPERNSDSGGRLQYEEEDEEIHVDTMLAQERRRSQKTQTQGQ